MTSDTMYKSLTFALGLFGCSACQSVDGDEVRGGALYDNWWAVTQQDEPIADHPLWASRPDMQSNTNTGAATWRCKECHGWDYMGLAGAYASGSHRTGFPGILGTSKSTAEIIDLLSDPTGHAYGEVLDEQSIADLATFVREGTIDTTTIIAADGSFIGDSTLGVEAFADTCALCHGNDGLIRPPGAGEDFANFPGYIANDNPHEFLHKVRFGQPGTAMPPQAERLSNDELGHLGAYAQTLPQQDEQDD